MSDMGMALEVNFGILDGARNEPDRPRRLYSMLGIKSLLVHMSMVRCNRVSTLVSCHDDPFLKSSPTDDLLALSLENVLRVG